MSLLVVATVASALMPPDLPELERQRIVAPFFDPRPGESLELDSIEMRDVGRRTAPTNLRGYLTVNPPLGRCLTVTRSTDRPDETICEKKRLAFTLGDLDRSGRLNYRVITGDGDYGTDIFWTTAYRLAITTPFDKAEQDPPTYKFIGSCEATKSPGKRRLRLGLVSGETWIVSFPDKDKLEPQPKAIPNLFLYVTGGKVSVKDAAKQKEIEAQEKAHAAADGGEKAAEPEKSAAPKDKADAADEEVDQEEDRTLWSIPARDAYTLSGSAFMPNGSVAPGGLGRCRYHYSGTAEDPETGRLECRDVDGFKHVLVPVTCLKDLR